MAWIMVAQACSRCQPVKRVRPGLEPAAHGIFTMVMAVLIRGVATGREMGRTTGGGSR